jgi:hypothetical protein
MTHLTQGSRVLKAIKSSGNRGVENWKLSRLALKYTSVISELRKDGHNIIAERQYLKNGRASNTYRYFLIDEDDPRLSEINQNKPLAL